MATIEKRKNDDGTTSYRVKIRLRGYAHLAPDRVSDIGNALAQKMGVA